jgi:hypothetical protein
MPRSQAFDFPVFGGCEGRRDPTIDWKLMGDYSRNSESSVGQLGGTRDSVFAVAHDCSWGSHDNSAFY